MLILPTSAIMIVAPAWHHCLTSQAAMSLKEASHDQLLMSLAVRAHTSLEMYMDGPIHIIPFKEALAVLND